MLKSTRHEYHQRIAAVMVSDFPAEAEAQPEYVALHFTEGGEVTAAVQWWQRAGRRAFSHAAYAEAASHFTKALNRLTSMPASAERDHLELALEVELGYALIPVRGWAASDTARAFTRAGELSRQIGDTTVHFRALWGLGAFHFVRGDQRQSASGCRAVHPRREQDERHRCDYGGPLPQWDHVVRDGRLCGRAARPGGVHSDLRDGEA